MDTRTKREMILDAQMDCLRGLNVLTDMNDPNTGKIADLACAIKDLQKTLQGMDESGEPDTAGLTKTCTGK